MSEAGLAERIPTSCSGGAQGTLMPRSSSDASGPLMAEMPKSESTGRRYVVNRMLAGLISRWTMPAR